MAVLSNLGATFMAGLVISHLESLGPDAKFYVAWGEGDPAWDALQDIPEPSESDTGLVSHLGHIPATWQWVTPNNASGAIRSSANERWDASVSQTPYFFIEAEYDFTHEPDATIRELALYLGATPKAGHENQSYFPATDLDHLGQLLQIERHPAQPRVANGYGAKNMVFHVG